MIDLLRCSFSRPRNFVFIYSLPTICPWFMPQSGCKSHGLAKQSLSVAIWLDGLATPSPAPERATITPTKPSRAPLQSTQSKLTSTLERIPKNTAVTKRKRPMDDESNDYGSRPRRSDRVRMAGKTGTPLLSDSQNHSGPQSRPQERRRDSPPETFTTTPPRTMIDYPKETEGSYFRSNLPVRSDRMLIENTTTPAFPPSQSPSKTSSRSSPSRFRGIKRESLMNLIPAIKFETVPEGKNHWPAHIQNLWRDCVSSLVHETKVVPSQLHVSRVQGLPLLPNMS